MIEIMIVIGILGLVMGLVVVPKVMDHYKNARLQTAKLAVDKFAYDLYPRWALTSHKECPDSLLEVAEAVGRGRRDLEDPWGNDYRGYCGAGQLPPEAKGGLAASSDGPDETHRTADDITSWDRR
jgi:type II secretory pathway pseudopilin PulG